eukprot:m.94596 g.94596  ORF g.94596 m.94596 type:complete len:611 (-) comp13453_c0_seq1:56-1888(-)
MINMTISSMMELKALATITLYLITLSTATNVTVDEAMPTKCSIFTKSSFQGPPGMALRGGFGRYIDYVDGVCIMFVFSQKGLYAFDLNWGEYKIVRPGSWTWPTFVTFPDGKKGFYTNSYGSGSSYVSAYSYTKDSIDYEWYDSLSWGVFGQIFSDGDAYTLRVGPMDNLVEAVLHLSKVSSTARAPSHQASLILMNGTKPWRGTLHRNYSGLYSGMLSGGPWSNKAIIRQYDDSNIVNLLYSFENPLQPEFIREVDDDWITYGSFGFDPRLIWNETSSTTSTLEARDVITNQTLYKKELSFRRKYNDRTYATNITNTYTILQKQPARVIQLNVISGEVLVDYTIPTNQSKYALSEFPGDNNTRLVCLRFTDKYYFIDRNTAQILSVGSVPDSVQPDGNSMITEMLSPDGSYIAVSTYSFETSAGKFEGRISSTRTTATTHTTKTTISDTYTSLTTASSKTETETWTKTSVSTRTTTTISMSSISMSNTYTTSTEYKPQYTQTKTKTTKRDGNDTPLTDGASDSGSVPSHLRTQPTTMHTTTKIDAKKSDSKKGLLIPIASAVAGVLVILVLLGVVLCWNKQKISAPSYSEVNAAYEPEVDDVFIGTSTA